MCFFFLDFSGFLGCMCVFVGGICVCVHTQDQRMTFQIWFSPATLWELRIELMSTGL